MAKTPQSLATAVAHRVARREPRDLRDVPWDEIPFDLHPQDRIAQNFRAWELWKSETAVRNGIDNRPHTPDLVRRCVRTAREILQPVRDKFGPFTPNSVFRAQATERALKRKTESWTSRSDHPRGRAADFEIAGLPNGDLARWIASTLEFDQLILELHVPDHGPNSGWIHCSFRHTNRRQVLSYVRKGPKRFVYVEGLVDSSFRRSF